MAIKHVSQSAGPVVRCNDSHDLTMTLSPCLCHRAATCEEHGVTYVQASGLVSWYDGGTAPENLAGEQPIGGES